MDDYRETIWGINPKDRGWFQLLTLAGGTAGSIILTLLELDSPSPDAPAGDIARNITLGIGASFVASGFIAWGLIQAKEMTMSIGDWIREANERRQQRRREQDYLRGYEDAQEGKPPQPPGTRRQQREQPPDEEGGGNRRAD